MAGAGMLNGRVALVVGASRGLGRAAAAALARAGAHVVIAARARAPLEALRQDLATSGGAATVVEMDVCDPRAIAHAADTIGESWGRLDILIANAAVLGPMTPLRDIEEADWRRVLETNLTANWALIRALDPLLQRSDAGRVVFVTSSAAARVEADRGAYAVSKIGLEMLAKTYAQETKESAIRVNLVDPGAMRTQMRALAVPGEDPQTLPAPEEVAPLLVELASTACTTTGELVIYRDWKATAATGAHAKRARPAPAVPTS